jgi:hypothetical protein
VTFAAYVDSIVDHAPKKTRRDIVFISLSQLALCALTMSYPILALHPLCYRLQPHLLPDAGAGAAALHSQTTRLVLRSSRGRAEPIRVRSSSKKQEAFLPYNEADGFVCYLWVQGVLPSFNGKKPPIRVRPVNLEKYPSLAGLGTVKGGCMKWPMYLKILQVRLFP